MDMDRKYRNLMRAMGVISSVLCVVLILIFSLTAFSGPQSIKISDKSGHYIAYVALGFTLFFAFVQDGSISSNKKSYILSFVIGMSLGVLVEIIQPFAGRSREAADAVADVLGLLTGEAIATVVLCIFVRIVGALDGKR